MHMKEEISGGCSIFHNGGGGSSTPFKIECGWRNKNEKTQEKGEYFGSGHYSFVCNRREEGLNDGEAREQRWRRLKGGG